MAFNDSYHLNMTDKSKYFGKSLTFSIGDLFYLIFFLKLFFRWLISIFIGKIWELQLQQQFYVRDY